MVKPNIDLKGIKPNNNNRARSNTAFDLNEALLNKANSMAKASGTAYDVTAEAYKRVDGTYSETHYKLSRDKVELKGVYQGIVVREKTLTPDGKQAYSPDGKPIFTGKVISVFKRS